MRKTRVRDPKSNDQRVRFAMLGLRACKSLFWHESTRPFPKPVTGASCFIVRIEGRYIGITAGHVVELFREARRANPAINCQLMHASLDLELAIVGFSAKRDVATFEVLPKLIDDGLRPGIIDCLDWPPPVPVRGAPTMFIGYPEGMRTINGPTDATFMAWSCLELIEDVTRREVVMVYDPSRSKSMLEDKGLPPPSLNLSGCSGGPALTFEVRNGKLLVHPAGVIIHGPGGGSKGELGEIAVVRAARLDCIRSDGTISEDD
jgi:hypothetical protein